jgi:sugar lactone lactonase YvrE
MESIIFKHLSGSKANQVEEFSLTHFKEMTVGRDTSSTIVCPDTQVSRHHIKITRDPVDPSQFLIIDLKSLNGTFVNKRRIEASRLRPGDVVQLGSKGPEFRFTTDAEEITEAENSEIVALDIPSAAPAQSPVPQTIAFKAPAEISFVPPPPPPAVQAQVAPPAPTAVQFDIQKVAVKPRSKARPYLVLGSALAVLAVVAAGIVFYKYVAGPGIFGTPSNNDASSTSDTGKSTSPAPKTGTNITEVDIQRAAFGINADPFVTLGGSPNNAASNLDKPAGVAFTPSGLLLASDGGNRRVEVWDVKSGERLGEFGNGVFGGEIGDLTVAPGGTVYVTDQTRNLAYAFEPPRPVEVNEKGQPLAPHEYQFKGTRFGDQGFNKLAGMAADSKGRIYVVDAQLNEARRFNPDGTVDKSWKFDRLGSDGDTHLHGGEAIAIDEAKGNLFISSEKDSAIGVFDLETGAFKHRYIGAKKDASGKPAGKPVFFGPVEGLAVFDHFLLAADKSAGQIQIFDLSRPDTFNTDFDAYAQKGQSGGYKGFFGHAKSPANTCSPTSVTSFKDGASGEIFVAVADRCNPRFAVYRWTDVARNFGGQVEVARESKPAVTAKAPVKRAKVSTSARPRPKPVKRVRPKLSKKDLEEIEEKKSSKKKKKP